MTARHSPLLCSIVYLPRKQHPHTEVIEVANKMNAMRVSHLPRQLARRTTGISTRHKSSFQSGPAPPRLPKEEQEIFERLQKQSTGAFSTPRSESSDGMRSSASGSSAASTTPQTARGQINQSPHSEPQINKGEEVHPNLRRGAPPEFEGDVNPKTGEVGGPKNEPLRWGVKGDWSYNGRVTDF